MSVHTETVVPLLMTTWLDVGYGWSTILKLKFSTFNKLVTPLFTTAASTEASVRGDTVTLEKTAFPVKVPTSNTTDTVGTVEVV